MNTTHRFANAVFVFVVSAFMATSAAARGTSKAAPATSNASGPLTLTVDCSKGQTISHALQQGDERKALVVIVKGTCNENVTINRDDVTLKAEAPGAGIVNGSSGEFAIMVRANRVVIESLSVRGGLNGLLVVGADNVEISNSDTQSATYHGIQVSGGSEVNITNCTVQNNSRSGIGITRGKVQIANSQIMLNAGGGLRVTENSSLRMDASTVSSNGGGGISLSDNSQALITGTTITANGTDSALPLLSRQGVAVNSSHADIRNSSITNHPGRGITDTGVLNLINSTVNGNGEDGVVVYLGAKLNLDGSTVSGNNGNGVSLGVNSTGQILGSTIQSNAKHGIELSAASVLWLYMPSSTVGGNGFYGLYCGDGESSVNDTSWLNFTPPNSVGGAYCTGF